MLNPVCDTKVIRKMKKIINNIKNSWVTSFPEGADPALLADAGTGEDGEIFQW